MNLGIVSISHRLINIKRWIFPTSYKILQGSFNFKDTTFKNKCFDC